MKARLVIAKSLDSASVPQLAQPVAAMLTAHDATELQDSLAIVGALLELGCVQICCVGPLSEALHDAVDHVVEERGRLDVVTTWHVDQSEACDYFVHAASRSVGTLLALVGDHVQLGTLLEASHHDRSARG